MAGNRVKLTKRTVDAIQPIPGKQFLIWDEELSNFGLCVSNRGSGDPVLTYFYYYRDSMGNPHRPTIGKHGVLTAEEARQIARKKLLAISQGVDPIAQKRAERLEIPFEDFSKRYMNEWSRVQKKPSTVRNDDSILRNHLDVFFKGYKLSEIRQEDIRKLRNKMRQTPSQGNRAIALLSHMFSWAEEVGLRPSYSNPCRGIKDFPETKRQRFLLPAEMRKLGEVLDKYEVAQPEAVRAIRLFLLTAMRLNEVLGLAWTMVDFRRGEVNLPDSKTGAKNVVLGESAMKLLRDVEQKGPWVIPSPRDPSRHMVNLNRTWHAVRKEAEIADVRIHDLRRTYGSLGAQVGTGMEFIQGIMGHKDLRTTQQHYAHLSNAPLHQVANYIDTIVAEELAGGEGRDGIRVVPELPPGIAPAAASEA